MGKVVGKREDTVLVAASGEHFCGNSQGARRTFRECPGEADERVLEGIKIYGEQLNLDLKRLVEGELLIVVTHQARAVIDFGVVSVLSLACACIWDGSGSLGVQLLLSG